MTMILGYWDIRGVSWGHQGGKDGGRQGREGCGWEMLCNGD